jgi:hypothetical protein
VSYLWKRCWTFFIVQNLFNSSILAYQVFAVLSADSGVKTAGLALMLPLLLYEAMTFSGP